MFKFKKNKKINLKTRDLKTKILGDMVPNIGVVFTIILFLALQSEKGDLVYSYLSIFDNFNNSIQMILALIFFSFHLFLLWHLYLKYQKKMDFQNLIGHFG